MQVQPEGNKGSVRGSDTTRRRHDKPHQTESTDKVMHLQIAKDAPGRNTKATESAILKFWATIGQSLFSPPESRKAGLIFAPKNEAQFQKVRWRRRRVPNIDRNRLYIIEK